MPADDAFARRPPFPENEGLACRPEAPPQAGAAGKEAVPVFRGRPSPDRGRAIPSPRGVAGAAAGCGRRLLELRGIASAAPDGVISRQVSVEVGFGQNRFLLFDR
jgi:hypothetical protein